MYIISSQKESLKRLKKLSKLGSSVTNVIKKLTQFICKIYCLVMVCKPFLFCEAIHTVTEEVKIKVNGATQLISFSIADPWD